jgi:putative transposase
MARPLRIELAGGLHHVSSRGNNRQEIYRQDKDRHAFVGLLAGLPERFGTLLHGYVLMPNHYHLVLQTPEANLSRAMHWLNVTYTVGFNERHQRSGHVFEGRFKSVLIEEEAALLEVVRYVHLNPVRIHALGLGKQERAAMAIGAGETPKMELVRERLNLLREYRWSSYRAYAGVETTPEWLCTELTGGMCGGLTAADRQRAIRKFTEDAVREGITRSPWETLVAGLVLGSETFAKHLLEETRKDEREQPSARLLASRVPWAKIVEVVEKEKGERWEEFRNRHKDWGRDVTLWLGRTVGRMRLRELATLAEMDYATVGAAVSRMGRRLKAERELKEIVERLRINCQNLRSDPKSESVSLK